MGDDPDNKDGPPDERGGGVFGDELPARCPPGIFILGFRAHIYIIFLSLFPYVLLHLYNKHVLTNIIMCLCY